MDIYNASIRLNLIFVFIYFSSVFKNTSSLIIWRDVIDASLWTTIYWSYEDNVKGNKLFINGCGDTAKLAGYNGTTFQVVNNYPGTCFDHCQERGFNVSYIALTGKSCRCIIQTISEKRTLGCIIRKPCPGHTDHYCGVEVLGKSTIYRIDNVRNSSMENNQCFYYTKANTTARKNCTATLKSLCPNENTHTCEVTSNVSAWTTSLQWCTTPSGPDITYYNSFKELDKCLPHFTAAWIGAFEKNAPPKQCQTLPAIQNGKVTISPYITDTADVICDNGGGNYTVVCMANGSWVNLPTCPDKKTTHVTQLTPIAKNTTTRNSLPHNVTTSNIPADNQSPSTELPKQNTTRRQEIEKHQDATEPGISGGHIAGIVCGIVAVLGGTIVGLVLIKCKQLNVANITPKESNSNDEATTSNPTTSREVLLDTADMPNNDHTALSD